MAANGFTDLQCEPVFVTARALPSRHVLPETIDMCVAAENTSALVRLHQLSCILERCNAFHLSLCPTSATSHLPLLSHPELIQVTPKVSLFDQKVDLTVKGLPTQTKVTLHLAVDGEFQWKPVQFASCGHYVTDQHSKLDLNTDASQGGTYIGTDPMGLFWSMEPDPSGPRNIRLVLRNVERPLPYRLSVYLGHLSLGELHGQDSECSHQPVAMTTVQRLVKSPKVKRLPVREGSVRGTLFLPQGKGPFPGVIDMFGFAGGLMESRGAMLASHGFVVLTLPIFNYEDLPRTVEHVNFNYFEETVKWMTSHPSVKDGGIGVVAVSGGAVFALMMGWKFPQVVAVVSINSPPFCVSGDLYYGDKFFRKGVVMSFDLVKETEEGLLVTDAWMYKAEDFIPIWESSTRVLALISDDDCQVSPDLADMLYHRYPENRRYLIQVVHYPGAGHLLEPPYTPHCRACYNPPIGMDLLWGGHKTEHAEAQQDAWQRTLDFLNTHLP